LYDQRKKEMVKIADNTDSERVVLGVLHNKIKKEEVDKRERGKRGGEGFFQGSKRALLDYTFEKLFRRKGGKLHLWTASKRRVLQMKERGGEARGKRRGDKFYQT